MITTILRSIGTIDGAHDDRGRATNSHETSSAREAESNPRPKPAKSQRREFSIQSCAKPQGSSLPRWPFFRPMLTPELLDARTRFDQIMGAEGARAMSWKQDLDALIESTMAF